MLKIIKLSNATILLHSFHKLSIFVPVVFCIYNAFSLISDFYDGSYAKSDVVLFYINDERKVKLDQKISSDKINYGIDKVKSISIFGEKEKDVSTNTKKLDDIDVENMTRDDFLRIKKYYGDSRLTGTITSSHSSSSMAIVSNNQINRTYFKNDFLNDGETKILKIIKDGVVVSKNNELFMMILRDGIMQ
ncbi:hypothetical protein QVN42_10010 [Yersinia nurmii]|uniref:General secretion pathway protein C n=1 Tax=Yersinia nurmii TaxID=685706 RepID=A0AAW7JZK2_9GAMM|nr:hypothetical protein [Yersinia nurmii]MDN0087723.1 hypothetical protein [Yersinia nurmii]CNE84568.1 Uncharacterised protein [Yersinia nurmii]